ncbi:choline dehydrogenase [Oscillatoriales cyanobacterium LEGE 11467]|uniref:Choline dehydrogenase n=1 Tax=Zarconia navalis LEGE 11467 TaxID=1828826 RepID=A0A928W393_9CYAN|nr:choline dehydrogenase [Zarconia navalis]MBE9042455.1 choline dehydrogenase [Zarconia navalis LEGE 11467]
MLNPTYDYIVVGGGSAGCVLANRLTENPQTTVLLLEAGSRDLRLEIQIPAAFSQLFRTHCDWAYQTEPQSKLHDRSLYWPRGKVLGGSSSLNASIYIRGHRWDYDRWQELGNSGWGFSNLLPYFKKAEHQERGGSVYHGTGGPLNVTDRPYTSPLSHAFVAAARSIGLPYTEDFNTPEPEGVGYYQVTQKRGRRHSSATAYLKPCRQRSNLTVLTDARATRLLWDGRWAVGVEFAREDGSTERVRTRRELILCGGAVNSPQLLMLSGVGAGDRLQALEIPVVVDLPGVGQNLQDHSVTGVVCECTQPISLEGAKTLANTLKYFLLGRGPLTSNVGEAGAFVKTRSNLTVPDLQLHFAPAYFVNHGFTKPKGYGFTLGSTPLRPHSRGYIDLRSPDPLAAPIIEPNYLSEEADWQVVRSGIALSRQILQASAFDAFRGAEFLPGIEVQSDGDIDEYIRAFTESLYHPVGTCKMGNDRLAVVNDRLQVRGTRGLRVVDASIMPAIVSGNTNAPAIAIAEKAADAIAGDR